MTQQPIFVWKKSIQSNLYYVVLIIINNIGIGIGLNQNMIFYADDTSFQVGNFDNTHSSSYWKNDQRTILKDVGFYYI